MVGALQETKWFGNEVYRVVGSKVLIKLTAGRPATTEGEHALSMQLPAISCHFSQPPL